MNEYELTAKLAVIIPAFKRRDLTATLQSLVDQTDQRFRVYVADDASTEALVEIVEPFRKKLDLDYVRFEQNLGGTSLISHWDRSIRLSREPWILLFSDDDQLSSDAVAAFYRTLSSEAPLPEVLQWDITRVDGDARLIAKVRPSPDRQSVGTFVMRMYRDPQFFCVMQNTVFRRELYERFGGFDDLPSGFWSDHLTWARFASAGGIGRIAGGRVLYRQHANSLGGQVMIGNKDRRPLIACTEHLILSLRELGIKCTGSRFAGCGPWRELRWFSRIFRHIGTPLNRVEMEASAGVLRRLWPWLPGIREIVFAENVVRSRLRQWKPIQIYLCWKMRRREEISG